MCVAAFILGMHKNCIPVNQSTTGIHVKHKHCRSLDNHVFGRRRTDRPHQCPGNALQELLSSQQEIVRDASVSPRNTDSHEELPNFAVRSIVDGCVNPNKRILQF